MQREAMAELLADLLLDHDLIDAQVELLLPLAGLLQPRSPMLKPMALQRGHSEALPVRPILGWRRSRWWVIRN